MVSQWYPFVIPANPMTLLNQNLKGIKSKIKFLSRIQQKTGD